MDRKNSWKRTEETEIDLLDLLGRICRQWKQIFICAIAFAVLLGGYGWMKGRAEQKNMMADTAPENEPAETELTEAEEQAVADAVRLEHEIRELEAYLDQSVLMEADPYHIYQSVMLYCVDQAEKQELPKITESYLNFVSNGGAAGALKRSTGWNMDKGCLAELISAYEKTYSCPHNMNLDVVLDSSEAAESLFYIEITGSDAQTAEKMSEDLQNVMKKYARQAKEDVGNHRLTLLSCEENVDIDSGLRSRQRENRSMLASDKASLKSAVDAFSDKQAAVYKKSVYTVNQKESDKNKKEDQKADEDTVSDVQSGFRIKYVILGFAGGIFIYCCIFFGWYIFQNTVKSADEMKRLYEFPVYGRISLKENKGKHKGIITGKSQNALEQDNIQVLHRIRLACQKQRVVRLYAASDFSFNVMEEEYLDGISKQLKECGIDMEVAECASADINVWDKLSETGNVLLVCKAGTTTHRMIDRAMDFYLENGIHVLGAVLFSEDT